MELLNQIAELLVGAVAKVAEGVGAGVNEIVKQLFTVSASDPEGVITTGLSQFGQISVIWGGIALSINLCKRILIWLTSFGN